MAPGDFSEGAAMLGSRPASATADNTAECRQHRVQWADACDTSSSETSGDDTGSAVMKGSIVKPKQHRVHWGGSETSEVKRKQLHVHWAEDVSSVSSDGCVDEGALSRGLLKKALGRSRARQWLLSQELQMEGDIDPVWFREIAATFAALRVEEGADRETVKGELLQIGQALTQSLIQGQDSSCRGRKGKAAGGISDARKEPRQADANGQEPEPEDEISLSTATVAAAREWFQWYSQHIIRSG
eukprot:CAMPEP_0179051012 /NCGR_PEP_ID=MMETSP0796-20121207/21028_1 /TAXON_ID=73915 /ORGANISM="Pyrodinium bahamense, Strain pbaha01" /LENGTH=242 /DNA_ID=CAMNT_0020747545 /DNA_START=64 /DNA_END=792 /DNA_ORIENTATION=+